MVRELVNASVAIDSSCLPEISNIEISPLEVEKWRRFINPFVGFGAYSRRSFSMFFLGVANSIAVVVSLTIVKEPPEPSMMEPF